MSERKLQSLAWKLACRLYVQEIQFSKHRRKITENVDIEKWRGPMASICEPRTSGARNKHFWRELLFDGTPEEHAKYVTRHMGQILSGKKPQEKPPIREMRDLLAFILSDPNKRIQEEPRIKETVDNFAIDFLSTVRAWSPTMPKYARKTFDVSFERLFESLYSDILTIQILIPIFRLNIAGSSVPLKENICIRRLEGCESFERRYLFPTKTSIEGELSQIIEMTRTIPRDSFDVNSIFTQADREFIQDVIDALSLFNENTVCAASAIIVNPLYEQEPAVAIPLEGIAKEANLSLTIDSKGREAFQSFLETLLETMRLLRTDRRLSVSHDFYNKALAPMRFEYRLLDIIICLEVLFGSFGKDTTRWVSLRAARLLGYLASEGSDTVLNDISRAFAARNEFLHKGLIAKGAEASVVSSMTRLLTYLRESIVCLMLLMSKMTYEDIMTRIDTAVQSSSVILFYKEGQKLKRELKNWRLHTP